MTATRRSRTQRSQVAIIDALRTPFVKSFGAYEKETPLALSQRVAAEILARNPVDASQVEEVIWGAVIPQTKNPGLARDIVLFGGLPKSIPGVTINRACASSLQSVVQAADMIHAGRADLVLAGGVEVLSDVPITYSDNARQFLTKISRAKTFRDKLTVLGTFNPKDFLPVPPGLTEPYTGLTMGQSAEVMAVKNDISRERQDKFAVESHLKAAKASEMGYLKDEVIPYWPEKTKSGSAVEKDDFIRPDANVEALAKLRPAFEKRTGTVTAGNSSGLTDGASAVLVASAKYAKAKKITPLGYVVDSIAIAVDPTDQLLIGPALAIPKLLAKNKLSVADIGAFEIHEAFAAQVLSCLDSISSDSFCQERLELKKAFGDIPAEKLNIDGGAVAIGHPFGATGGRLISRGLRIARRKNEKYAVVAACTAGGMGQALLLEVHQDNSAEGE